MKRTLYIIAVFILCTAAVALAMSHMADVKAHSSCKYCGMDRHKFAHSRMLIKYDDGTEVGTCSIHCAALDLALNIDKSPADIMVGDFNDKSLINAEEATWVLGGDKKGVMTSRAKWAFADGGSAEKFANEHGGEIVDFDLVMSATYSDMYKDTKMIRKMRAMRKSEKGHSGHGH
ncbi:MAG: NosL family protein [Phycisphaerae bacterium]|nr:NosL family protein [Phycisphaerae bacterium]NIS54826.1 NosL family protein [Phycisphaerae bacterium]NIX02695.1 NosL family protein [Phycisphaerae bacterium]NIX32712.1 NosL family protein [Phycisphaerae bacterium]